MVAWVSTFELVTEDMEEAEEVGAVGERRGCAVNDS